MSTSDIRIIITGGTFDKQYDPLKQELRFADTHLPDIIKTINASLSFELEINQLVDSLQMTDDRRRKIAESVENSPERNIIITHGTDTMALSAEYIQSAVERCKSDTTVVFTGAMVPYSVSGSDALFNLGCAVAAVQTLGPGVFVAMNGRIFPAGSVKKNLTTGVFVDTRTSVNEAR